MRRPSGCIPKKAVRDFGPLRSPKWKQVKLIKQQEVNVRRELDSLVTQMHSSGIRYEDAVRDFKRQFLREVLAAHRGNQCKAADELGIHRNTLSRIMADLDLDLAEVRAGLKRPVRSERPVFSAGRQKFRQG